MEKYSIATSEIKFETLDHLDVSSFLNMYKKIYFKVNMPYKTKNGEIKKHRKIFFTNAGWMEHNGKEWFCPAKFYPVEARKFIESFPYKTINFYAN